MTIDRPPSLARLSWRGAIVLVLVFALSVGLVAVLPSDAPVALAGRLFQSPVETPTVPPTTPPEQPSPTAQPTTPPEQPTATPAPPEPVPTATVTNVGEQPPPETPTPAVIPTEQSVEQPLGEPSVNFESAPVVSQEPEEESFDWVRFIDTTVLVFSWFWLGCGIVVVIVVVVLVVTLYVRSKRRQQS